MTLEERLKKDNSKGLTIEERVKKNRYTTSEDNSDVDLKTRYLSSIGSSEKIEPYKSVMANEDFAEKSKYVAEGGYGPWNDIKNAISAIKGDQATNRSLYENINEPVSKNPFKNAGKAITEYLTGTNPYSMLTDEEKALYNYYYNTGDYETAQNLYSDIIEEVSDRVRQYQGVRANEQVDNLGDTMLVWPETVLPNVASGLAQVTTGGLAGLATAAQGEGFAKGWNDFAKSNFVGSNVDALRSAGGQYLGEKTGTKIIPEAYQAAMSVLDSIVTANLAMGVAGSEKASKMVKALTKLPMSGNAARAKAIEVLDRGGTETEAALSSVASGVWEYLTESIGTDAMFDILTGKINAKTAKEFIVRALLASSGAEAAEEGLSDLGNLITDFLTMDLNNEGTESELMQRYHKYLKIGFDDVTAKGIAFIMFVDDTLTDMLGGALGGLFGAGIEIPSGLKRYNSYGKSILQNENVPQLAEQLEKEGRTDIATTIKENPTKLNVGFAQDTLINNAIEKATAKNATEADYNKYVQTMNEASRNLLPKTGITDKKGNILHLENIIWEGDTPTFVTKEGTFNAKDVNVSDSTNHMISFTENLPEASRKAFVENYNGENLGDYVNKFVLIYDTGKRGLTKDLQRYIEDGLFPKDTVYNIYNAALSDASSVTSQLEREKMRIATRRELYRDKQVRAIVDDSNIDLTKLTDNQKDGIRFTSQIAKGFNVNVVYYDSNTTNKAELKNANGEYYDPTNTIFLDINAKNTGTDSAENAIVTAMSHELTHWAKALSPEFWFSFRKNTLGTLTDEYNKDNGTNFSISEFVEYMHKVTPNYKGKSTEKVEEELICRACENMLQNSDFAYATIKQMTKDEQQKLGDKIKDLIDKAIQMLRNIMFRSDSGSYMSQLLAKNEETFNELKEQWDEMIKTAAENSAYLNAELQENGTNAEHVERNFSVKVDSAGKELTADQQIFYADESPLLKDAEGRLKRYYHGTARMDRVGTVFDPARATSGPMAFFTDNKEIATNYSKSKSDTSLSRDNKYDSYYTQFRLNVGGKDMSIGEAWNKLPSSKRAEIMRKAEHVTFDEENETDIIYDATHKKGLGNFDEYLIREHKGNYLNALVHSWLEDANLWNSEQRFLEVLKLVGIEDASYMDPNYRNEGVYEVYLHVTNPFDTSNISDEDLAALETAAEIAKKSEVNYAADLFDKSGMEPGAWIESLKDDIKTGRSTTFTIIPDWVTETLKSRGYDGIVDSGGKFSEEVHQVVIPFYSEQVKNVTNEHPTINPDINLSWKDDEGYLHLDFDDELSPADIEKLVNDYKFNKQLNNAIQKRVERREKNRIAKLRQIDREMKLSPTKINDLAKELKETYELPQSIKEISDGLKEVYLKSTDPSFDSAVNELMVKLFKDVKSTYIDYDLKKEADNFKKALHKETITLSENQKKELRNVYGASWHKDHFLGRVSLKSLEKGGTLLDSRWSELVEAYPDLFPDPTDSDAQEGVQLAEVLDLVYSGRLYTSDSLDMTRDMKRTFIEAVKRGKWDVVEDLTMAEKYTEVIGELREKVKQAEGLKKEVEQAKKDVIENAKRRMIADKIIEREVKLSKMLIKNGQKTGEHIPQILEQPLKDILEAVDVGAYVPEKMAKNFVALANALENVSTNHEAEENLEMYFDSSEHFVNQIREIAEELQKKVDDFKDSAGGTVSILDLSTQSLTKLNQTLAAVTMAAHKYDRALASENNARISDRDKSTFEFVGEFTKRGKVANWAKDIITFFAWDNTTPVYGYDRFGKGGKDTFKGIMEGDDQLTRNSEKIINFCKDTFTGEELEQWNKEIHDDVRINRKTYAMTTTQIMTLYCLNRRQAAQQHLYEDQKNVYGETVNGQGIVISANDKSEKTVATTITKGEVTQITNLLTKRQKEVAEKLQEFMSTVCSDWGNYVTFKRFGILQFEEDNYFPMNVSQALAEEKPTPGGSWRVDVFRLLNMSFTNSLNERGNGALIIDNIFDVFFKHCGEMSAYNAYALPILDAYKWMSYKGKGYSGLNVIQSEDTEKRISFSEVVEQAYGSDGLNFLQNHLRDLNGTKNISSSAESLAKKIIRNYKTAATAANLRVTLMQPTAYFRAANEIDVKYLAKAMTLNPKQIKASVERMNENSTLAQKKNGLGAFDVNVSRSIAEQAMQTDKVSGLKGIVQKAKAASMWFAMKADEITWATLYHAVELEMKDKAPNLDNVEYKRLVEERFRDICYRTQVFDSINARSNLMRKTSDTYLGILTAFGSEPTLSYSMLVNNVFMYTIDARDGNKQRAWKRYGKKIGRAFAAYLMSAVAVSAVAALPDWMRDDEEDDGFLKKYFKQFGLNLLSEPLGLLPYLRDIPDIFKGYNPSRPDEEIIKTLKQFGSSAVKAIQDGELSYRTIYQAAKLFSQATGLPLANVIRDVKSLWNKTIGEVFDMKIQ